MVTSCMRWLPGWYHQFRIPEAVRTGRLWVQPEAGLNPERLSWQLVWEGPALAGTAIDFEPTEPHQARMQWLY